MKRYVNKYNKAKPFLISQKTELKRLFLHLENYDKPDSFLRNDPDLYV